MRVKDSVKVNADYINAYLHRNHITQKEFCEKLMYTASWWSNHKSANNFIIPKHAAMRMCDIFGLKWNDLVGENPPQEMEEPQEPVQESDDLKTFMLILQNIDEKLKTIEERLKGLEWLHK